MLEKPTVIAVDGPAGSGKSTAAKQVAQRLGFAYVDSGALYRAYTLACLRQAVPLDDPAAVAAVVAKSRVQLENHPEGCRVFLNGEDVTGEIRSPAVTASVSTVAEYSAVREAVNRQLRETAEKFSVVVDGRDIGTAVFPDADLKIYLEASVEERARRRYEELRAAGREVDLEEIKQDIERRDRHDANRSVAPLSKAPDAVVLDTTEMTPEDVVAFIVEKALDLHSAKV